MLANEIKRCEQEMALAREATMEASTRPCTQGEAIGLLVWELDWWRTRERLLEEMEAAERLTLIGRIKRIIRNWRKSLQKKVTA
jgi:hypothetical protein